MPNPCTLRQASLVILSLLFPTLANAQQAPTGQSVGVVTAIQGQAAVSRVSLPQPEPLHFKDDVFFRDQIATRERSTVRLLLGGKGTLTIREQSQVTLDESVSPDGARQSVISILTGKIAAAIAHALMRPGDVIEIRTPNAVAAVRGTVLVAEYIPPQGSAATDRPIVLAAAAPGQLLAQASGVGGTSNFLVISGQITITLQGLPPVILDTLQSVSITETPVGLQTGPIQNVTPAQAANRVKDLQIGRPTIEDAGSRQAGRAQAQIAATVANVIVQNTTGQAVVASAAVTATTSTASTTTTTATSVTPPPTAPQSPVSGLTSSAVSSGSEGATGGTSNTVPNGSLLTLSNVNLTLADGISLATFSAGAPNTTILPVPSGELLSIPLLTVTGNPIAHSGTIVTVDPSTLNGATGPTEAPLVAVNGTTLTNSEGPIFGVSNSFVSAFWPVLQLAPGANATVAGVMNIAEGSEVSVGPHDAVSLQSGSTLTSTDALFQVGGNSALLTTGGAGLVAVDPGTLILQAPILSATGNSGIILLGPALHAVDSTVTSTQPLVLLQGTSTFASTGPLVLMNGGSLTADSILKAVGTPTIVLGGGFLETANTNASGGVLLDLTNAGATFRTLQDTGNASLTYALNKGQPVVHMTDSNLTLTGSGEPLLNPSSSTQSTIDGLGLVATSSTGNTISLAGPLLRLGGFTFTATDPYIQLTNMTVSQTGSDSLIQADTSIPATVNGPLLSARGGMSTFTIAGSLLRVVDGSTLISTTTLPLLQFSGSTINAGSLLFLRGVNTDPETGLGTDVPLTTGGTILELDSTTVNLNGTGNAIRVDTATLNALGPIINMINSSLTTSPTGNGLMNVSKSNVTLATNMEVVRLDKSVLTVQNGPLLTVTGGSQMTVNGDFASLLNGSRLTVVKGPMISVDGVSANGITASTLNVSGALVNFGGTGGNQVIISNNISSTSTLSGIPVNTDRNSISIGPNPIKNPSLGTFTVTGSAIQAINGGKVTITAK